MEDIFNNNKDILEKISFCLPIVILQHDSYPHKICDLCCRNLETAFSFIYKTIATDKKLKQEKEVCLRSININCLPLDGPTECDICKTMFTDMNLFDKHIEDHKYKMEFMYQIEPTLPVTTYNNDDLGYEQDKHIMDNNAEINERRCGRILSSKCTSINHKFDAQNLKKKISKVIPPRPISENDNKIHERLLNKEDNMFIKKPQKKLFICNLCNETFQNNKELKTHSLEVHNSTLNADWVCKFCSKSMTTKVGLLIHERIHDGSKPYICEWCGNGFRSRANLTQHQVIHTGIRKYPCPRCNKRFSRRSFVETHMRVHTGERPYCCDICGYRFTQIGDMRRHRNKHQTYPVFTSPKVTTDQLVSE